MGYYPLGQNTFLVRTKISRHGAQGHYRKFRKIGLIVFLSPGIVTKRVADIFLARVSKSLEAFVNKSDRTVQNEGKQKHPPQH